jgi:hypothetical protein
MNTSKAQLKFKRELKIFLGLETGLLLVVSLSEDERVVLGSEDCWQLNSYSSIISAAGALTFSY